MFKRTQRGELAVTLSIIGLLVSLIGITVGSLSSLQLQGHQSSANDLYTYKSTLEVREGSVNGPVINFEPGFTWSNGLPEGKTGAVKGDIKMPNSPKAQLVWDATKNGGVTRESGLQGKAVYVEVAIPAGWTIVGRFCEDKNPLLPTCNDVQSFHRLDMFGNIVITNGAEIVYGIVVKRTAPPVPPTSVPNTPMPPTNTPVPVLPTQTPASCPVSGTNCAPRNVHVTDGGLNEKSVEVTWDVPTGCPAYVKGVSPFWIDVVNVGKAYHSGYIACAAESTDDISTCTLGKEQLPGRLLQTDSYEFTQKKWVEGQDYNVNVFTYNANPSCVSPANTTSFKYEAQAPDPQPQPTAEPSKDLVCSNRCVFSEQKPGDKVRCYKGACPADQKDCGGGVENVNHGCAWAGAGTACNLPKEEVKCESDKPAPEPSGEITLKIDTTTGEEFYDELGVGLDATVMYRDGKSIRSNTNPVDDTAPKTVKTISNINVKNIKWIKLNYYSDISPVFTYNQISNSNLILFSKRYEGSTLSQLISDAQNGKVIQTKDFVKVIKSTDSLNNGAVPDYLTTRASIHENPGEGSKSLTVRTTVNGDIPRDVYKETPPEIYLYIAHDTLASDPSLWTVWSYRLQGDTYTELIDNRATLAYLDITSNYSEQKFGPISDGWYMIELQYSSQWITGQNVQAEGCARSFYDDDDFYCLIKKNHDSNNLVTFTINANPQPKQLSMGSYMISEQGVGSIDSSKSSLQVCSKEKCIDIPSQSGRLGAAEIAQATKSLGTVAYLSCTIMTQSGDTVYCLKTNPSYEQIQYVKLTKGADGYTAAIVNESELADLDGDKSLTGVDLATVMDGYPSAEGDINQDGKTDARDLAISIGLLGQKVMPSSPYKSEMSMQSR